MTTLPDHPRPSEGRKHPRRGPGRPPKELIDETPTTDDREGQGRPRISPIGNKDLDVPKMIERLVTLLRRRGDTQNQFEAMTGLAKNRISKWVMGEGEPTARQLWRMARALNVPIEHFLDESATLTKDQPPPDPTPDRPAPNSDLDLAIAALVRELGPVRAIRALASALRKDRDQAAHPIKGSSPETR